MPLSGFTSPVMTRMIVDLPVPLRPTRQTRSPGSIWRSTPSSSSGPPNPTVMSGG